MDSTEQGPRDKDWLAYILPLIGFAVIDCLIAIWLARAGDGPTLILIFGTFAGQLLWGAAWCALGPGRWVHRFVAVVFAGIFVAGVMAAAVYSQPETPPTSLPTYYRSGGMTVRIVAIGTVPLGQSGASPGPREAAGKLLLRVASAFPLALLIAQLPLCGARALRGWQIVFCQIGSRAKRIDAWKFGIADLLAATAGVAIALGFWRINLLASEDGLGDLIAFAWCTGAALIGGLFALPVVAFSLGGRPQSLALGMVCASIIVLGVIAPAAAALTMYASFWVARDVGYRLVRLAGR